MLVTIKERNFLKQGVFQKNSSNSNYVLPDINLLKKSVQKRLSSRELEKFNLDLSKKLELTLGQYGVEGRIVNYKSGPVVTLFEFVPAAGVKTSKIVGLSEDIARAMSSVSTRIATQPGKTSVGIEIPNQKRESVLLGDLIDDDTMIYSMSLGKSLGGYLMGHAICKGYINSLSSTLADWPILKGTLLETATVQDLINASTGDQKYIWNNNLSSGRDIGDLTIASIAKKELANTKPGKKRFNYSQFSPNVALNYISFKTGHKFNSFINDVLKNHVGLAGKLRFNGSGVESKGVIQSNFKATRYDTLRIGIAILNDWNSDTCIGNYLKDVYANRVSKGAFNVGDGYSQSYAGFFHTNYPGISDTVMGMDGYGGVALLINFDDNRIVYTHAVHRDYNYRSLVLNAIDKGIF